MSALPCLTNIRSNAPIFQITAGGGNIPLNQDIVCSTITVGETATIEALVVSSINGVQPGGGGGGGVTSIEPGVPTGCGIDFNGKTGDVTMQLSLIAGTNISIEPSISDNSITISATGGGGGSYPPDPEFSSIVMGEGGFIELAQGNINISSINGAAYVPGGGGGGGITQITAAGQEFTGAFTINAGAGIDISTPSSGTIEITATGGGGGYPSAPSFSSITMDTGGTISMPSGSVSLSTINSDGLSVKILLGDDPTAYIAVDGTVGTTDIELITLGGSIVIAADAITTGANCDLQVSSISGVINASVSTISMALDADNYVSVNGTKPGAPAVIIAGADVSILTAQIATQEFCDLQISSINGLAPGGGSLPADPSFSTITAGDLNVSTINGAPVTAAKVPILVDAHYSPDRSFTDIASNPSYTQIYSTIHTAPSNGTYIVNAAAGILASASNFASWYLNLIASDSISTVLNAQSQADTDGTSNIFNATIPVITSFEGIAGTTYYIVLNASQNQALSTELVTRPSMNVMFYPA